MAFVDGGDKTKLITYYTLGEDASVNYGRTRWLAQTFTLADLYVVWRCRFKSWTIAGTYFYHYSIRATDGTGMPTGPDLASTSLSPTGEYWYSPGKWRRFDFGTFPNLPAGVYALIASVPDTFQTTTFKLRCDATAPTFTEGKAWLSNDSGATWSEIANTDFMFEVWGWQPPPTEVPEPVISNWAPLDVVSEPVDLGYTIVVTTDIPVHLFMRWTTTKPLKHPTTELRRGINIQTGTRYCFVTWNEVEQMEAGDTLTHTFIFLDWPICETRYFYFIGTKRAEEQPSASPIFHLHRIVAPSTRFFNAYSPSDLYVSASGSWVKVDSYSGTLLKNVLPSSTTALFLHIINRGTPKAVGLRPHGSPHAVSDRMQTKSQIWAHVAVDADISFDAWLQSTFNQDIILVGYATAGAVIMFETPVAKQMTLINSWETLDLSSTCPDAIGILFEAPYDGLSNLGGIRMFGSGDNRTYGTNHNWGVVGCDPAQKIQVFSSFWNVAPVKIYITGYIIQSATFNSNAQDKSLVDLNVYKTISLAPGPSLAFFEAFTDLAGRLMDIRPFASPDAHFYEVGAWPVWPVVPMNALGQLEGKIDHLSTDFWLLGTGT